MADRSIKQNDTGPPMEATLNGLDGPINLTTATEVRFLMKGTKRTGAVARWGVCDIMDAVNGEIRYRWKVGDTDVADMYLGEFQIVWADGTIWTVPNDRYFYVEVKPELGS